jgi:nuclear pore complex protein Nup107
VEKFAEYVDRWQKTKEDLAGKSETEHYKAAKDLAATFGKIAEQKYKELKQKQSRRNSLSKSWRGRIESLADSSSPEPRGGIELSLRASEDGDANLAAMRQWKAETDSWKLLVAVTDLHASKPTAANKKDFQRHHPIEKYSPNPDLWTAFIFEDDAARERKVVLEWLEKTANDSETTFDTIVEQLESRTGTRHGTWQHGWLNTRERIKAEKRLRSINGPIEANEVQVRSNDGSKSLVTQLDPDAPTRQKAPLEKQDEHYERSLWLACYEMLRRGKSWEDIQEWFEERNEGWRAASLGAAQDLDRQNSRLCLAGPYAGALWRRMCLAASKKTSADKYERAVYGLLAGDTESVEQVCQTWEDLVYMNYNSLLLASFEAWLQHHHPERFSSVLPQKFPLYKPVRAAEEVSDYKSLILEDMLQRPNFGLSPSQPIRWIQAMLITDKFEHLVVDLSVILATRANESTTSRLMRPPQIGQEVLHDYSAFPENYDAVRIIVHMIIIFSEAGLKFSQELDIHVQNIFVSYIEMLRLLGKIEAIPTYARFIDDEARYEVMGSIVAQIKDHDEQERLVRLMAAAELNVTAILSDQYILAGEGLHIEPGGSAKSVDRFTLVETASLRWAGWRIRGDFNWPVGVELTEILSPEENEVVWAVQWFFRCNSTYQDTFFGLTYILKELLSMSSSKGPLMLILLTSRQELATSQLPSLSLTKCLSN